VAPKSLLILSAALVLIVVLPVRSQPKKDGAELQGVWKLTAVEIDGKAGDPIIEFPRWVIKGNMVRYGGADLIELTIDAATTPKCMDLAFLAPKKVLEAVYKVEGDTLKICVNRAVTGVKERPSDFKTEGKADRRLLTFQRDKSGKADGPEGPGFVGIAIGISADKKGLTIANVIEGSPAEKAGLKRNDLILRIAGAQPTDVSSAVRLVRQTKAGNDITFRIRRADNEQNITFKAGVVPFIVLDE
jgi:uncharacterized protein (TIGR03067 family)